MADFKTITLPVSFVSRDAAKGVDVEHSAGTALKMPVDMAQSHLDRWADRGAAEVEGDGVDVVALANPSASETETQPLAPAPPAAPARVTRGQAQAPLPGNGDSA